MPEKLRKRRPRPEPEELDEPVDDTPSKTQRKKEMHALQDLGERLLELKPEQLQAIPMEESLRDAIIAMHSLTAHEARRRQQQFIGRLMRDADPAPIREALAARDGQSRIAAANLHLAERWRDRLIDEETALAEFAREYALRDWQTLRSLVVEARKERSESRPPRRYREVFRSVREILDAAASEIASKAASDQAANASPDDVATTDH
jgi:ribosome-associated protein